MAPLWTSLHADEKHHSLEVSVAMKKDKLNKGTGEDTLFTVKNVYKKYGEVGREGKKVMVMLAFDGDGV